MDDTQIIIYVSTVFNIILGVIAKYYIKLYYEKVTKG